MLIGTVLASLAWAALQSRPGVLVMGSYGDWQSLAGFYHPERSSSQELFRWSSHQGTIRLPAPGDRGLRAITLRLHGGRPAPQPAPHVHIASGQQQIMLAVPNEPRHYTFLARPAATADPLSITIQSDTFRPAERTDDLGVVVFQAAGRPLERAVGWRLLGGALALVAALGLAAAAVHRHAVLVVLGLCSTCLPALMVWQRHTAAGWLLGGALLAGATAAWWYWLRQRVSPVRLQAIALLHLILLLAAALRIYNLNWDDGAGFHVDEHLLNQVALALRPPYNPEFFAYGSLPIYLYRATGAALSLLDSGWLDPRTFPLIGRSYAVLVSILTVGLTALLGRRLAGGRLGLVAALFLACTVLAIQLAHFGTTDSLLTFVATVTVWTSLNILDHGRRRDFLLSGALIGLGAAIKITALTFGLLPALAIMLRGDMMGSARRSRIGPLLRNVGAAALAMVAACVLASPYYLLDAASWLHALQVEWSDATSGVADYTRQFIGTTPYFYFVQNFPWTLGWPLMIAALAGAGIIGLDILRHWRTPEARRWAVVLVWALGYFVFFGRFHDKYIRYTLPLTPVLALCAARAVLWPSYLRHGQRLSALAILVVGGWTGVYALAFTNGVYGAADARLQASHWLTTNVRSGTTITREQYDVRFPIRLTSDHSLGSPPWYLVESLQWYAPDTPAKAHEIAQQLSKAEYMVIASRSVYRPSLDHPDLFAMNARFFQQVFSGTSGLREVVRWQPMPHLGPLRWPRPAPEETFEVFDHPTVIIYRRSPEVGVTQLEALLSSEAAR